MVKCPRGTPSQVKANLQYNEKSSSLSFESDFFSKVYDPTIDLLPEFSDSELDSIRANKRVVQTAKSELLRTLLLKSLQLQNYNYYLNSEDNSDFYPPYFVKALSVKMTSNWEGKPCKKPKLNPFAIFENEYYGEMDVIPCEDSDEPSKPFTADTLKTVYEKRNVNIVPEKRFVNQHQNKCSDLNSDSILGEEDYELPEAGEWNSNIPDEYVKFTLKNGVWYNGRVSRRLMDGTGVYFWEDGALYEGEFEDGCATGKGRIEFPDLSLYEGGVYKAFRHGEGMHCLSNSPVMYSGQWWLGLKHGYGLIVYEDPASKINFYRGYWEKGVKEGFGYRQYPSGSKYIGFWSDGKRQGYGVMLWSNNDIYKGYWKEGLMHGYGEYTWNGFVNKSLSYPASNTYRGHWSEGMRNGQGIFETKHGGIIETVWVNNIKEGPGAVVCCNGTVVVAENLFFRDREALCNDSEDKTGLLLRDQLCKNSYKKMEQETSFLEHLSKMGKIRSLHIPIYASVHSLALDPHTLKYFSKKKEELVKATAKLELPFRMIRVRTYSDGSEKSSEEELNDEAYRQLTNCALYEEQFLRSSIIANIRNLKACYEHYSTIACEEKPSFKCVLLRLFLWQLFVDSDLTDKYLSLVDIDNLLAEEECLLIEHPHNPFECIQLWQFIHTLITLSWHLYAKYLFIKDPVSVSNRVFDFLEYFENLSTKYILKSAFEYLLERNIFRGRFNGNYNLDAEREKMFEETNLVPMEAMYKIYKSIGEPHTAKQFVKVLCRKSLLTTFDTVISGTTEILPDFKLEWKNALTVAGELTHISGPQPFNSPETNFSTYNLQNKESDRNLPYFKTLTPRHVVKCLAKVCPGIVEEGIITNMDYELTFLEFYRAVVLCTEFILKLEVMDTLRDGLIEDYKNQMKIYESYMHEQEKLKELNAGSSKKSRQTLDSSKKRKNY